MSSEINSFEFGEFLLDTREKVLLRKGKRLPITPKVFQMLLVLVENHGRIVEKEQLMQSVWTDSFVEDSNLTFTMRQLRKALGDDKHNPRFIETVSRRGYRFIAEVSESFRDPFFDKERQSAAGKAARAFWGDWHSRLVLSSIFGVLIFLTLLTAGFFVWSNKDFRDKKVSTDPVSPLKFETLTSSDKPMTAAISPDGKYIAYTSTANGQQSLWLRQLSSGINTQIVAPAANTIFHGLKFSNNGEYIYFSRRYKSEPVHLNRVSIFGGAVKTNILNDLDGAFSISPDDRLISFRRYEPRKRSLLVAQTDGSETRVIFETSQTFTDNVFSPDGKTIAFASGQSDTGDRDFGVYLIGAEGGESKPATDFKWHHVRSLVWLPGGRGLLVTARIKSGDLMQLWEISLPNGEVKKITDTQNSFEAISATGDLSQILLAQISLSSNLYLAPAAAPDNLQPVTQAYEGVAWTPEGNLVYGSAANGNHDIWLLDADKINRKQLTTDDSSDLEPQVSPDGRYIVFVSDRAGKYNLWRMKSDGTDAVQLTNGEGEQTPVFTTDGRFVVYSSMKDVNLWKVSIEGGAPVPLSDNPAYNISISPDGTKFAHFSNIGGKTKAVVKTFPNGEILQELALPDGYFAGRDIIWAKDGSALIYATDDSSAVGNLWLQRVKGGAPQKLTDYNSEEIFYFDFSPDGSQLALIRGSWNYDLVLLKGYQK